MPTKPDTYKPSVPKARQREHRPSSHKRGYDKRWYAFRSWFIQRYPLCEDCLKEGVTTATEEVHHKKKVAEYPELKCVEDNCRALCKRHHSIRTRRGE